MTKRKYEVFISSTYKDLVDERKQVMLAILELGWIPAGMELFPAADDTQWTVIKEWIDRCDYFITIVGGRYGLIARGKSKSYIEREYRYAKSKGKRTIAFLHKAPS